jgi:hypothetical protein
MALVAGSSSMKNNLTLCVALAGLLACGGAWADKEKESKKGHHESHEHHGIELPDFGEHHHGGGVSVTPVPEPETLALLGAGAGVVGVVVYRRRKRKM